MPDEVGPRLLTSGLDMVSGASLHPFIYEDIIDTHMRMNMHMYSIVDMNMIMHVHMHRNVIVIGV